MKKLIILLGVMIGLSFGVPVKVNNYYQLESKEDLEWFRDSVNRGTNTISINAKLLVDIDYENQLWIPIAAGTGTPRYAGIFDGNGHTISNYYIDSDELKAIKPSYQQNLGFIGALKGTVKNLNLENITVKSYGVGGTVPGATSTDADAKEKKAVCVGTIAGWMDESAKIDSTSATGTLNGFGDGQNVGGVAGNSWGIIKNSSSAVTINVKNLSFVGGIVGMTKSNVKIDSVLWEGNINVIEEGSTTYIGGIIGDVYSGSATVSNATFVSDNVTNSVGKTCATCKLTADKLDYGVYSILFNNNKKTLVLNGDYTKSMSETVFDKTITVDNFVLNRTFTTGVFSTLSLPITLPKANIEGLRFYELNDVYKNADNQWEVHVKSVQNDNIEAGIPYIVIADQENVTFTATSYTFTPVTAQNVTNSTGKWTLNTYHKFMVGSDFGDDLVNVFGFAGKSLDGAKAGDFVRCGKKVKFKPFRVYLHKETQNALLKARQYPIVISDTIDYDIPIIIDTAKPDVQLDTTRIDVNPVKPPDTLFVIDTLVKPIVTDTILPQPIVVDIQEEPVVIRKNMKINVYKPMKKKFYNLLGRRIYDL